jgi:hypothetical protein
MTGLSDLGGLVAWGTGTEGAARQSEPMKSRRSTREDTLWKEHPMPLTPVKLAHEPDAVPGDVRRFLSEAARRVERFQRRGLAPGFVASDFTRVFAALRALEGSGLLAGRWFCEWGSGLGVVSCLAAGLGFDAWGIEIEGDLVHASRRLADDFGVPAEFVEGSFLPRGADALLGRRRDFAWLSTDGLSGYEQIGIDVADFDAVFAYPWPDEEGLVGELFEHYAQAGALLLTYHGGEDLLLRRKTDRRRRPL